jgi:hypothetical protein
MFYDTFIVAVMCMAHMVFFKTNCFGSCKNNSIVNSNSTDKNIEIVRSDVMIGIQIPIFPLNVLKFLRALLNSAIYYHTKIHECECTMYRVVFLPRSGGVDSRFCKLMGKLTIPSTREISPPL